MHQERGNWLDKKNIFLGLGTAMRPLDPASNWYVLLHAEIKQLITTDICLIILKLISILYLTTINILSLLFFWAESSFSISLS